VIRAMAARSRGDVLAPCELELPDLERDELEVDVEYCALCHSDLHLIDGDWSCSYPLVPGHEIVGRVVAIGPDVAQSRMGERVGIGWQCGSCGACAVCEAGREHLCSAGKVRTCVNRPGGFAQRVVASSAFAYPVPETIASPIAAPLMCAGLTGFSALERLVVRPGMTVGVIGIGGLGHLAVQFAAAMGCRVRAFDVSEARLRDASLLGVSEAFHGTTAPRGDLDLLLSTTSAGLDWNHWLLHLKPGGTLCLVGYPPRSIEVLPELLLDGERRITGSVIGSPATMLRMLDFAARMAVRPMIEELPMSRAADAVARLRANDVKYRMVLRMDL